MTCFGVSACYVLIWMLHMGGNDEGFRPGYLSSFGVISRQNYSL